MKQLLFLLVFLCSIPLPAQDTIKVEKSVKYSSRKYPVHDKHFASIKEYAREDIVYSAKKQRTEFCYYLDKESVLEKVMNC